ncbi:hypothetical protein E1B28_010396 [Marasmius oreades]|uniref:Chromo domain-containing protein n=1 Tax=Marasmius oreades TaxID=181124 RepID=A0A9P7UTL2_9AGAR|nr:uncharacterized protein E1B28_010396 [Marasmius oreades]KAG7091354.1 hypothetical protein E1B28_010396 [Marasmius oreades]
MSTSISPPGARPSEKSTIVHLPGRHRLLPTVFQLSSHPLIPAKTTPFIQHIYLIFKDLSEDAATTLEKSSNDEGILQVPSGPNEEMCRLGLLKLEPGDVVFMRRLGCEDPAEDVIRALLLSERIDRWRSDLNHIRDRILGPQALRLPGKPKKSNGRWTGGIAFERNDYIEGMNGSRCYSLGLTRQCARNVAAPVADNRVNQNDANGRELRGSIVQTCSQIGIHSLQSQVPHIYRILNNYAEVTNLPRLGDPQNSAYPAAQLNTAGAVTYNSDQGLSKEMNIFGDSHKDIHDASGALSGACSMPDVPEGYEAGRFHLLEDGVYYELDGIKFANFSGLQKHGGTPPRAPLGQPVEPWATRLNVILYPPTELLNGTSCLQVAPWPDGGPLVLPSELIRPEQTESIKKEKPECSQPTFTADAGNLMDQEALANFVCRSGVQVLHYLISQLPSDWNVHFNPSALLESIKMDVDGEGVSMKEWPTGPNGRPFNADGNDLRAIYTREWLDHCRVMGQYVTGNVDQELIAPENLVQLKKSTISPHAGANNRQLTNTVTFRMARTSNAASSCKEKELTDMTLAIAHTKTAQKLAKPPPLRSAIRKRILSKSKQAKSLRSANGSASTSRSTTGMTIQSMQPATIITRSSALAASSTHSSSAIPMVTSPPTGVATQSSLSSAGGIIEHNQGDDSQDTDNSMAMEIDEHEAEREEEESNVEGEYEVEQIIGHKPPLYPTHYYIKWKDYDDEDSATWERLENLANCAQLLCNYHCAHNEVMSLRQTRALLGKMGGNVVRILGHETYNTPWTENESSIVFFIHMHPDYIVDLSFEFDEIIEKLRKGEVEASALDFVLINEANQCLLDKPLDEQTPCQIASFHVQLRALGISICRNSLEEHLLRSVVLDSYHNLYAWIRQFHQNPQSSSWFGRLYSRVCGILDNATDFGSQVINISSSDYLSLQPSVVFAFHRSPADIRRNIPLSDSKRKERVEDLTAQVVLHWLGFRCDNNFWTRLQFLGALWETFTHPAIHLLKPVYEVFMGDLSLLQKRDRKRKSRPWTSSDLNNFLSTLEHLPRLVIDDYRCHLQALSVSRKAYENERRRRWNHGQSSNVRRSDGSVLNIRRQNVLGAGEQPLDFFIKFLRSCFEAISMEQSKLTTSQKTMLKDLDGFYPFREQAPSRSWIVAESGPFHHDYINTRSGLFSALVFRGITFHTPSVTHHSGRFDDIETWNEFRVAYQDKPESWFCSNMAYGPTKGRSTKNVTELWKFSEHLHNLLHSSTKPSFFQVVQELRTLTSWGILTAYLCAVDLVYAQVLDASDDDVVEFVVEAGKGAYNALKKLGFSGTALEMTPHFRDAYRYVSEKLSEEEKVQIGWNVFIMEHALCKFSKLFDILMKWGL